MCVCKPHTESKSLEIYYISSVVNILDSIVSMMLCAQYRPIFFFARRYSGTITAGFFLPVAGRR